MYTLQTFIWQTMITYVRFQTKTVKPTGITAKQYCGCANDFGCRWKQGIITRVKETGDGAPFEYSVLAGKRGKNTTALRSASFRSVIRWSRLSGRRRRLNAIRLLCPRYSTMCGKTHGSRDRRDPGAGYEIPVRPYDGKSRVSSGHDPRTDLLLARPLPGCGWVRRRWNRLTSCRWNKCTRGKCAAVATTATVGKRSGRGSVV